MYSLVNSNFNRTYNPTGCQNALSEVKRLLTSRDISAQKEACGYIVEAINQNSRKSDNDAKGIVEYLLDNDITVFLCEATTNLDFSLFSSVSSCLRLLGRSPRFFRAELGAAAAAAGCVLRALAHYAAAGDWRAATAALRFLYDLLNGVSGHKASPVLSAQSAYSAEQVLAVLAGLAAQRPPPPALLAAGMLLEALLGYLPEDLYISSSTVEALVPVVGTWVSLVLGGMQHAALAGGAAGAGGDLGPLYLLACLLPLHSLSLLQLLQPRKQQVGLVQSILAAEQDDSLRQCVAQLAAAVQRAVLELVAFTKEHERQVPTEEYGVFLQLLLASLQRGEQAELADALLAGGYLALLPRGQVDRQDEAVRAVSTAVLGALLSQLAHTHLAGGGPHCAPDIQLGLAELARGVQRGAALGAQLRGARPYTLLVYIYFYCQATDNPEEAAAPLLPALVDHLLQLPESCHPPPYIVKALWLVFAMSCISSAAASLAARGRLERAGERLAALLLPRPARYYSHHPALLLWAFSSHRIHAQLKYTVVSEWLKLESSIPAEFSSDPGVRELLLSVLLHSSEREVVEHCAESLQLCAGEGAGEELAELLWAALPGELARALVGDGELPYNVRHVVELAASLPPRLPPARLQQAALLLTGLFSRSGSTADSQERALLQYACLKLCLKLLDAANKLNDLGVLLTCVSRAGFLPAVLSTCWSSDTRAACTALQLLSYVVHNHCRRHCQPASLVQLPASLVVSSLRRDWSCARGAALLQVVYIVLNSGASSPLVLAGGAGGGAGQALRALMIRVQQMLCTRSNTSAERTAAGWKTLGAIFKHALLARNDSRMVAALTTQPWTFILIQFHLSQPVTAEFLTFLQNWLTLLKIAVESEDEQKKLSEYSLVTRTLLLLRRKLRGEGEQQGAVQAVLGGAGEILQGATVRGRT